MLNTKELMCIIRPVVVVSPAGRRMHPDHHREHLLPSVAFSVSLEKDENVGKLGYKLRCKPMPLLSNN